MFSHRLDRSGTRLSIQIGIVDEERARQSCDMVCIQPVMLGTSNDCREVPIEKAECLFQRGTEIGAGWNGTSFDNKIVVALVAKAHALVLVQLLSLSKIDLENDPGNG